MASCEEGDTRINITRLDRVLGYVSIEKSGVWDLRRGFLRIPYPRRVGRVYMTKSSISRAIEYDDTGTPVRYAPLTDETPLVEVEYEAWVRGGDNPVSTRKVEYSGSDISAGQHRVDLREIKAQLRASLRGGSAPNRPNKSA